MPHFEKRRDLLLHQYSCLNAVCNDTGVGLLRMAPGGRRVLCLSFASSFKSVLSLAASFPNRRPRQRHRRPPL